MIAIKDAVGAAKEFVYSVYDVDEIWDLRLEEVEADPSDRLWNITLGWVEPKSRPNPVIGGILAQVTSALPRVYKTFQIDAETGRVRSMKIRETA